jgi:hypothetical protein
MKANLPITICLGGLSVFLCLSAEGQQRWSHGGSDASWFTPANWSGDLVPAGSEDFHLNANSAPSLPVIINDLATAYVNTLKLGNAAGEAGYLEVHTALTCSNHLYVGDMGTGIVTQAGGLVSVVNDMLVGEGGGGFGGYTLTNSAAVLAVGHFLYVARDAGSVGELTLDAGRLQVVADLIAPDAGRATLSLLGGALVVGRDLIIGNKDGAANGIFEQQAGSVVVSNSLYVGGGGDTAPSTNHTYRLMGGSLAVTGSVFVGYAGGQGFLEHTGGSLTVGGRMYIARSGSDSHRFVSEYSIAGDASLNVADLIDIGSSGAVTYQVTGTVRIATSHSGAIECQGWTQRAQGRGVLEVTVDSPTCQPVVVSGDILFESGSLLDVTAAPDAVPGSFTVLECVGTLTDSGLQFAAGVDTRAWHFTTTDNRLVVTYAPPPPSGMVFIVH